MKKQLFLVTILIVSLVFFSSCTQPEADNLKAEELGLTPTATPTGPVLFSFIVYGDNGSVNPVFEKIIQNAEKSDAAFVASTGDSSEGRNQNELRKVKDYLDKNLTKPYHIAIGDNDYIVDASGERTASGFETVFGNTQESFDYETAHFVVFNSTDTKSSFTDAELDWLETDLAKTDKDFTFIFMHVPIEVPMAESYLGEPTEETLRQNQRFTEIITEYGVDQIYAGHFHGYLNYEIADIPVAVTGGGGSSPQFGLEEDYHYLEVSVYEDGVVNKYQPVD